jgi:UDP-GlcNAc:undecaprenyl-phosphate GlcNAc-1-phosphate transferase
VPHDQLTMSGSSLFAALLLSLLICTNARPIGQWLKVMDEPDGVRKRHALPTPLVGGLAIMIPLITWVVLQIYAGHLEDPALFTAIAVCGTGVALIGFIDDQTSTSPGVRVLFLLLFYGAALMLDPGLITKKLHWGSFTATEIPTIGFIALLGVTAVGLVNSVNMADGQNGVVLGMFLIWSVCLALVPDPSFLFIALTLAGLSLLVLGFNLAGKLFLGDCGTYGVTFVFGLLAAAAHAHMTVRLETIVVWFFVPVADCIRLLIARTLQRRSPFAGDRDHFHHRLEDKLGRKFGLVAYLSAVAVSSLIATLRPQFGLLSLVALSAFYFSFARITDGPGVAIEDTPLPDQTATGTIVPIKRDRN